MSKKAASSQRVQVIPGIAHAPFFFRFVTKCPTIKIQSLNYYNICLIFRTDIKRTKEYLLYTDVKLLGDVVNYIGLIIGICLLNLADVFGGVLDKYMR